MIKGKMEQKRHKQKKRQKRKGIKSERKERTNKGKRKNEDKTDSTKLTRNHYAEYSCKNHQLVDISLRKRRSVSEQVQKLKLARLRSANENQLNGTTK